jgi:hypothetical protein
MTPSSSSLPLPNPRALLLATSLLLAPVHFNNGPSESFPSSATSATSATSAPPFSLFSGIGGGNGLAAAQLYASGSNTAGADYAVRMTGSAQYMEVPGMGVDLAGKTFTLEVWVKRARGATEEVLFSQVGLSLPGGCHIGYMDHTGCHQLVFYLQKWRGEKCQPCSQGTGSTGKGLQFGFLANDKMRFSFWNDGDCDNVYNTFDAGSGAVVEQW